MRNTRNSVSSSWCCRIIRVYGCVDNGGDDALNTISKWYFGRFLNSFQSVRSLFFSLTNNTAPVTSNRHTHFYSDAGGNRGQAMRSLLSFILGILPNLHFETSSKADKELAYSLQQQYEELAQQFCMWIITKGEKKMKHHGVVHLIYFAQYFFFSHVLPPKMRSHTLSEVYEFISLD